jgi:hypothetical protein
MTEYRLAYTIRQTAHGLGVSELTIRRWIRNHWEDVLLGEERHRAFQDLDFHLRDAQLAAQLDQLGVFVLGHAGPAAVLDVGLVRIQFRRHESEIPRSAAI